MSAEKTGSTIRRNRLTSYTFSDIYDSSNIPANAYPASDLGLYEVTDAEVIK